MAAAGCSARFPATCAATGPSFAHSLGAGVHAKRVARLPSCEGLHRGIKRARACCKVAAGCGRLQSNAALTTGVLLTATTPLVAGAEVVVHFRPASSLVTVSLHAGTIQHDQGHEMSGDLKVLPHSDS